MVGTTRRNDRIFDRSVVGMANATPSMMAMAWIPVQARMISTRNPFLITMFQAWRSAPNPSDRTSQSVCPTTTEMSQSPSGVKANGA